MALIKYSPKTLQFSLSLFTAMTTAATTQLETLAALKAVEGMRARVSMSISLSTIWIKSFLPIPLRLQVTTNIYISTTVWWSPF